MINKIYFMKNAEKRDFFEFLKFMANFFGMFLGILSMYFTSFWTELFACNCADYVTGFMDYFRFQKLIGFELVFEF